MLANNSVANYPEGGGHWSVFLQYMFGLNTLDVKWYWLEIFRSTGNDVRDNKLIGLFFRRMHHYGFKKNIVLICYDKELKGNDIDSAEIFGTDKVTFRNLVADTDIVWNFCGQLPNPLLSKFSKRAYIDLDPGHLQVSALTVDMGFDQHDIFFTVGSKINDLDCKVPKHGKTWIPFFPVIYLPMWKCMNNLDVIQPFSSVTQWNWGELWWGNKRLSISKRDAYLRYLSLPKQIDQSFELAANIDDEDEIGDRIKLQENQWKLVDPHDICKNPAQYRRYMAQSKAELSCPKPIYRELKTGWFSDRSAAYLASSRPVLAEDTGFSDHLPTGTGLLTFTNLDEAIAGVDEINTNYLQHQKAAREIADEYFDSRKVLTRLLSFS